jgi:RNA polymerase sigma factor (sigma-70 family)
MYGAQPRQDGPTTSWTAVQSASTQDRRARSRFALRYAPVIRRYLASRWRIATDSQLIDDGIQEVFVECFKRDGALERVRPGRDGGFRAYLYAVTRNVARTLERQRRRVPAPTAELDREPEDGDRPSVAFDRAWARLVTADAMTEFRDSCSEPVELLQLEVLRLRYHEGLPPRQIAQRIGGLDARRISKLIERGLRRYKACLLVVLRRSSPTATDRELERSCRELLQLL